MILYNNSYGACSTNIYKFNESLQQKFVIGHVQYIGIKICPYQSFNYWPIRIVSQVEEKFILNFTKVKQVSDKTAVI